MISNILLQTKMNYYCDICDKSIKLKIKKNHFKSLTYIQYEKIFRINHTIRKPYFFHIKKKFNVCITNHNKNFHLYLIKCAFKFVSYNFTPYSKTGFYRNTTFIKFKRYKFYWIEYFIKRTKFFHFNERNISTINEKRILTYERCITKPMRSVKLELNMIMARNLHLMYSLSRCTNHPSNRKYSHIPFKNK